MGAREIILLGGKGKDTFLPTSSIKVRVSAWDVGGSKKKNDTRIIHDDINLIWFVIPGSLPRAVIP